MMTYFVYSTLNTAAQQVQDLFRDLSCVEQQMLSGGMGAIDFSPSANDGEGSNPYTFNERVGVTKDGRAVTMGQLLQSMANQGLVPSRAPSDLQSVNGTSSLSPF